MNIEKIAVFAVFSIIISTSLCMSFIDGQDYYFGVMLVIIALAVPATYVMEIHDKMRRQV